MIKLKLSQILLDNFIIFVEGKFFFEIRHHTWHLVAVVHVQFVVLLQCHIELDVTVVNAEFRKTCFARVVLMTSRKTAWHVRLIQRRT